MQLPEKYKESFEVMSESPSKVMQICTIIRSKWFFLEVQ
jgi:hypothetical protein